MIYYYIYYIFYRIAKNNNSVFPNEFVAGICVLALNLWLLMSLVNEFYFFTNIRLMPKSLISPFSIIVLVLLIVINWFLFENKQRWNQIIKKIENSPSKARNVFIAWCIVIFVILNYWIISLYLLSIKS